jgi:hypothetical protein
VVGVIEEDGGVDGTATEANLEVEMWGRGTARLSRETDDLTGFYFLTNLHKVLRLVTIACREAVGVADNDIVAITEIRP